MPDPIIGLRRAQFILRASGEPACIEIAEAIQRYQEEAHLGMTLDRAIGVNQRGGAGPWWIREARERRDAALLELREEFFPALLDGEAAVEIGRLASRRMRASIPAATRRDELLDRALRNGTGRLPGGKRLKSIIGNPKTE